MTARPTPDPSGRLGVLALTISMAIILLAMFYQSFEPGHALFSNDGPLAAQNAKFIEMPAGFFGMWNDLYWLGTESGSFVPNFTALIVFILSPLGYSNFHAAVSLILLGFASYLFFRQLKLSPGLCVVAALAATFNGNFISNAGWGLSSRATCLAMTFLALAALESSFRNRSLIKTILAGLAVGMSVSEGGDNGAIFSLFVAAYAFVRALTTQGEMAKKVVRGLGMVALTAVCAGVMAAHTISFFIGTGNKGAASAMDQQATMTPEQKWDWATQWSLPKAETLRVIIPGLYGYKLDTLDGGNYWGGVGRDPHWTSGSGRLPRHSGAGEYAGVLVVLIGIWAFAQSLRKAKSTFSEVERKMIWFWIVAALVSLVFSWGRHAPFYQIVYHLPFFSSIRNPMKFMHVFHLALMILFAYGLQGLSRLYLEKAVAGSQSLLTQMKEVWRNGGSFEKRWIMGCVAVLGVAVLGYMIYATSRGDLVDHLKKVDVPPSLALSVAKFSIGEVGLFLVFLLISIIAVLAVQSGWFGGKRAAWAAVILGFILSVDLYRANTPWINYYDYEKRYASNPVIEVLKENSYNHRVTVFPPFGGAPPQLAQALGTVNSVYQLEWLQHHFLYYNILSLDVPQDPRPPAEKEPYLRAVGGMLTRYWQLTSTRYILGVGGGFIDNLNAQLDPVERGFRQRVAFNITQDAERTIHAVADPNGPYALIELTNALPRLKLYSTWEVNLDPDNALTNRLASPDFKPSASVIVHSDISPASPTNANTGTVQVTSYSPRRIEVTTQSENDGVLLLNDRFHPSWVAEVDGQSSEILRCNYLMRGVQVPAGTHTVVFRYAPPVGTFYITLTAVIVGLLLSGILVFVPATKPDQ